MIFKAWKLAGLEADIEMGMRAHRFWTAAMYRRPEVAAMIREQADDLLVNCPKGRRDEFYETFLRMKIIHAMGFCADLYTAGRAAVL